MTDHAAEARRLLGNGDFQGKGYWSHAEAYTHSALCGIGHALLAIHEALTPAEDAPDVRRDLDGILDRVDETAEKHPVCLSWDDVAAIRAAVGERP